MAGLSHVVTVQLGHSDDAVQLVLEKYGEGSVDMASQSIRGVAVHESPIGVRAYRFRCSWISVGRLQD